MKTLKTVKGLQRNLTNSSKGKKSIGFVPTMGALHEGHLALVKRAKEENDIVVVSIFVNPTQFNDKEDLIKYPRNTKSDQEKLRSVKCDYLFLPSVKTIYPRGTDVKVQFDFCGLDREMEGAFREGHFDGVAQVVKRLLDIVKPNNLYMGQKDFQQFTIINHMINSLSIHTEMVVCPIVRESDGLAMSSRNLRLLPEHRKKATILHETLNWVQENIENYSIPELEKKALKMLNIPGFRPEYVIIADGFSLKRIKAYKDHHYVVCCLASWAGEVRLIDNIILKQ